MSEVASLSRKEAVARLWEKGILHWKLHEAQKDLYDIFHASDAKTVVWGCSRRLGKSWSLITIALEQCLKFPNSIVKYVAPEQKMVRTIIKPLMREITKDCPRHLKPKWSTRDVAYIFPNGSEIQLAGTDNGNVESLRGGRAELCLVDEAGFCNDLEYTVKSILLPTMTTTGGKIILSSTPPISADHEFVEYIKTAKLKGSYGEKTIDDIPTSIMSKKQKDEYIEELGGRDSVAVRREYYVEIITDSSRAIVPEFTKEIQKKVVREWPRPPFYDCYTSLDHGVKDLTVALFAYYDFRNAKLIIEDEFVINGPEMTTKVIADGIKAKEARLWKNPFTGELQKPYLRVSDNNLQLIADMSMEHGVHFVPTEKKHAEMALNSLRMLIADEKVIINPRCVTLIDHLENGLWNKARGSFERMVDKWKREHHCDAVDSVKYLVRNVNWAKNPYPPGFSITSEDIFENPNNEENLTQFEQSIKKIFTVKSTIRRKVR